MGSETEKHAVVSQISATIHSLRELKERVTYCSRRPEHYANFINTVRELSTAQEHLHKTLVLVKTLQDNN